MSRPHPLACSLPLQRKRLNRNISAARQRSTIRLLIFVFAALAIVMLVSYAWLHWNRVHHRGAYSLLFSEPKGGGPGYPTRDPTLPAPKTCDLSTLTNNASWPAACQFAVDGPWHQHIPDGVRAGEHYARNSLGVVTQLLQKGRWIANYIHVPNNIMVNRGYINGGGYPSYVCQVGDSSCIQLTISCSGGPGWCSNRRGTIDGLSLYLPKYAIPESNGGRNVDNHMNVLDCVTIAPNCREVNLYNYGATMNPPSGGYAPGTVLGVAGGDYTDPIHGDGWGSTSIGGEVTRSRATLFPGYVRSSEMENGIDGIPHAIQLDIACGDTNIHVFPATGSFGTSCPDWANAAPAGARFYWDEPCDVISMRNLDGWSKALLCALHNYGGYAVDTNGFTSIVFQDSEMPFGGITGFTDYVTPFAQRYGTNLGFAQFGTNTVYSANLSSMDDVDVEAHFHMLEPCVNGTARSQGSCPRRDPDR
jgi:hypothetical protein